MSEFVYELPKNRVVLKCPVCGLSGLRSKRHAAFMASREYVTVQGRRDENALLSAICRVRYLIPQTY